MLEPPADLAEGQQPGDEAFTIEGDTHDRGYQAVDDLEKHGDPVSSRRSRSYKTTGVIDFDAYTLDSTRSILTPLNFLLFKQLHSVGLNIREIPPGPENKYQ